MFWSGNYIVVRELNSLLKEENVSLSQVLEADDILQECKADNKVLIQYLTKPEILAELITLITEEPSKNVELTSQYRHANLACEVLTSHLSKLSEQLSQDAVQMNRLCDFLNKDPPLNPLLASYFSKTVEMLLDKGPKQDWYLYHIVCLRVLDFFKSRQDFLPNLLRHISTSAIADVFKYFIRLDDVFTTVVLGWLDQDNFLLSLIQIICGTYIPEEIRPSTAQDAPNVPEERVNTSEPDKDSLTEVAKVEDNPKNELTEKISNSEPLDSKTVEEMNHNDAADTVKQTGDCGDDRDEDKGSDSHDSGAELSSSRPLDVSYESSARASRLLAVAAANAADLLCDLLVTGCAREGSDSRPSAGASLLSGLFTCEAVSALLQSMFTAPPHCAGHALPHGARLLWTMLTWEPIFCGRLFPARNVVELSVAPHLPLLHQALLHQPAAAAAADHLEPSPRPSEASQDGDTSGSPAPEVPPAPKMAAVGAARVQIASLIAKLAESEVEEVSSTLITLGTPGVLIDMMFAYPNNNFLHAEVYAMVKAALSNQPYRTQYAKHLIIECDLLTRLMDAFEQNEEKKRVAGPGGAAAAAARSGYMGHCVLMLKRLRGVLGDGAEPAPSAPLELSAPLAERWRSFVEGQLAPALLRHDAPLGGFYPSETVYEDDLIPETGDDYSAALDNAAMEMDEVDTEEYKKFKSTFMMFVNREQWNDDMLSGCTADGEDLEGEEGGARGEAAGREGDDEGRGARGTPTVEDVLQPAPWEAGAAEAGAAEAGGSAGEGWAQFGADAFGNPVDPFAGSVFDPANFHSDLAPESSPGSGGAAAAAAAAAAAYDEDAAFHAFEAKAQQFTPFWGYEDKGEGSRESNPDTDLEQSLQTLRLENKQMDEACSAELANNLLTAMSSMTPEVIANIVNANLTHMPDMPALTETQDAAALASESDNATSEAGSGTSERDNGASQRDNGASQRDNGASQRDTEASQREDEASQWDNDASQRDSATGEQDNSGGER